MYLISIFFNYTGQMNSSRALKVLAGIEWHFWNDPNVKLHGRVSNVPEAQRRGSKTILMDRSVWRTESWNVTAINTSINKKYIEFVHEMAHVLQQSHQRRLTLEDDTIFHDFLSSITWPPQYVPPHWILWRISKVLIGKHWGLVYTFCIPRWSESLRRWHENQQHIYAI